MLNYLWLGLLVISVISGVITHHIPEVVASVTTSAKLAFDILLNMVGIMVFWMGLMRIAEDAGFITLLAKWMRPLLSRLFPEVPHDHPAMGDMLLNMTANFLGLSHAATPFGLRAMEALQRLNTNPKVASNAMCMFLAINTSSIQLIPASAIAFLAAAGGHHPTSIVLSGLLATSISTAVAITTARVLQRSRWFRADAMTQEVSYE